MRTISDRVATCLQYLEAKAPVGKQARIHHAYRQFAGVLSRIQMRYAAALRAEWDILMGVPTASLSESQERYVDKVESFHQQVYAVLSGFALVLTHVWPAGSGNVPTSSIARFLEFLRDQHLGVAALDASNVLEHSRDYRARYVDHPQQHKVCDWHTFSNDVCVALIYGSPTGAANDEWQLADVDPYRADFVAPPSLENAFIAPHASDTIDALHRLILDTLETITLARLRRDPDEADARFLLLRGRLEFRLAKDTSTARWFLDRAASEASNATVSLTARIELADTHETDERFDLACPQWSGLSEEASHRHHLGHFCRLQRRLATHAQLNHRFDEASAHLARVIARGEDISVRELAACLHFQASLEHLSAERLAQVQKRRLTCDDLQAAARLLDRAMQTLGNPRDEEVAGGCCHNRAAIADVCEDHASAVMLLLEATCSRELAGDRRGEASSRTYLAHMFRRMGRPQTALAHERRAERARRFF